MKTKLLVIIALLGIGAIASSGCGGDPGSPGSSGSGDTGVVLDATVVPFYKGGNTYSVDVVLDDCDDDPVKFDPEYFADHSATVTFAARLINTNPRIRPGTLYVKKYTIEFRRSSDSIGAPPIESDTRFETIAIVPPQTGSDPTFTTASILLVDLIRKNKYLDDILGPVFNGRMLNNYTAIFTFYGENEYGEAFTLVAETSFQMGHFDYCD